MADEQNNDPAPATEPTPETVVQDAEKTETDAADVVKDTVEDAVDKVEADASESATLLEARVRQLEERLIALEAKARHFL